MGDVLRPALVTCRAPLGDLFSAKPVVRSDRWRLCRRFHIARRLAPHAAPLQAGLFIWGPDCQIRWPGFLLAGFHHRSRASLRHSEYPGRRTVTLAREWTACMAQP